MIKDKIFTEEELLKVTELATNYNNEKVANYFSISGSLFSKLKHGNKELSVAFTKGVNARKKGNHLVGQRTSKEIPPKKERNTSYQELSPQEALDNFNKQFKENLGKKQEK